MNFKHIFVQWGKWATPRLEMDYPCVTVSIPVPYSNGGIQPMNDDLAMNIHECLMTMRKVNPRLYDVFLMTYAYRMPRFNEYDQSRILVRKGICETLGVCDKTYRNLLQEAESALSVSLVCMNYLTLP